MIHLLPLLTLLIPSQPVGNIVVNAGRGPVIVRVPASYDPAVPTPIVVLLHGYSGTGAGQEAYMQLGALVDTFGFLYLHPDGLVDPGGLQFWNGTDACCDFFGTGVDDVGYLFDLLDLIRVQMNVDPARVHFVGHSNGGFMSYHLACDRAGEIASIVSLAGATFLDPAACAADEPVHVLQIHGTSDNTILFGGGQLGGNAYPGAVESAELWAASNGCDVIADTSSPPINLDSSILGPETTVARYESACDVGGSSELWTIHGGGHIPSLSNGFASKVLNFLYAHTKPEVGSAACTSTANSTGLAALLTAYGSDSLAAETLTLVAFNAPPNTPGLFIVSATLAQAPFGDGVLCLGAPIVRVNPPTMTSAGGEARRKLDFSAPYGAALTVASTHFQFWFRDPAGGPAGFNLSAARTVVIQP